MMMGPRPDGGLGKKDEIFGFVQRGIALVLGFPRACSDKETAVQNNLGHDRIVIRSARNLNLQDELDGQ